MRAAASLLAVALALAAPAAAQAAAPAASHLVNDAGLLLVAGERVTMRLGAKGRLVLVSVAPADKESAAPPRPGPPKPPGAGNPLVETAADTVAVVLGFRDNTAWLKVENGTSKAFDYRAVLMDGAGDSARAEPTSVCTVLPLLPGYASWEKRRVPAILLSNFVSRDTNEVDCPQPPKLASTAHTSTMPSAVAPTTRGK